MPTRLASGVRVASIAIVFGRVARGARHSAWCPRPRTARSRGRPASRPAGQPATAISMGQVGYAVMVSMSTALVLIVAALATAAGIAYLLVTRPPN
jgi:hypothetical protein